MWQLLLLLLPPSRLLLLLPRLETCKQIHGVAKPTKVRSVRKIALAALTVSDAKRLTAVLAQPVATFGCAQSGEQRRTKANAKSNGHGQTSARVV